MKTKNIIQIFFAGGVGLFIWGCTEIKDSTGKQLVEEYQQASIDDQSTLTDKGTVLLKHLNERLALDVMEPESTNDSPARTDWLGLAKKTFLAGLEKNDAAIIVQIPEMVNLRRFELTVKQDDEFIDYITNHAEKITFNDEGLAASYNYIGKVNAKRKDFFEAYKNFAKAVILSGDKDRYAASVVTLLNHFGCKQDMLAWSEYSSQTDYYVQKTMTGSSYPEQTIDAGFNVGLARKSMIGMRAVPALQVSCPINLYKK
ncbi:hypothetical protein [Aeromonas caviae]|uniref:hypothetical protein n=1 Tax=Aeromonas caviae TaxID=648 RepID=UPI002B47B0CD|nr:hypothetical protein [Aeromonas caviae]